jgi:adenylosuccinate lyase
MISRYDKSEISTIWSEEEKFRYYLEVELAILKSLEGDKVPAGVSDQIREKAKINVDRINEIELETRHDMIAFCSSITEDLDPSVGKYFHFGVTSSDIIDSALTLQIKASLDYVIPALREVLKSLKARAVEMKDVLSIGRSHGMFAEPLSFGQKLLGHYNEFARRLDEYEEFYKEQLTIQYSGAVGNYTILNPEAEKKAAELLGVHVEPHSTQVIPRDRHAKLITIGSLIGSAIERLSVEIRHLHRSDVDELHEGFAKGQKGSSTMPHKKNPISGENLTGMARMLRSHSQIAMDNIVLWHERDISHSSTERMMLPDHFGILYYALTRLKTTIDRLEFHNDKIEQKVFNNFTYLSSYYLHFLIEKTNLKRDELYRIVQEAAFEGHKTNSKEDFFNGLLTALKSRDIVLDIPEASDDEVRKIFTKHVDEVFNRSFELYPCQE